jgi:hypothetical protein
MDMVGDATDRERFHVILAGDTSQVGPEAFANCGYKNGFVALRREDAMVEGTATNAFLSSLTGLYRF